MPLKIKINTFFLFLFAFIVSCKKETQKPLGLIDTVGPNQKDTANYISGWLRKYVQYNHQPGTKDHIYVNAFGCAYFTAAPISITNYTASFQTISGGTVTMDQYPLPYNTNSASYYLNIPYSDQGIPVSWHVGGNTSAGIQPFDHVCSQPFPAPINYKSIAGFISKTSGLTLSFNNLAYTDRIKVYILNSNYNEISAKEIFVTGTSESVSFSTSELSNAPLTSSAFIDIYVYNDEINYINNKNIRFSNVIRELITNVSIVN